MRSEKSLFTVREVARIFGLNESRIRYWAQTGFINPSGSKAGKRLYNFNDLVGIKSAKELLDGGIPLQRVRKNLQALREALPEIQHPLTKLRICSDGDHIVVEQEDRTFEPISGQMVLDFQFDELHNQVAQVLQIETNKASSPPPRGTVETTTTNPPDLEQPSTAYSWFLRACAFDFDPDKHDEAVTSYRKAIELDPKLAAAYTNLGNLHYRFHEREEAKKYYKLACQLEPEHPQARYNLANLYEEEGQLELAISEYRRSLSADPEFLDAHFNLALVLEMVDSHVLAAKHWRSVLELAKKEESTLDAEWVEIAHTHLSRLEDLSK